MNETSGLLEIGFSLAESKFKWNIYIVTSVIY